MKLVRDYTVDERRLTPADDPEIEVRGCKVKGFYDDHGDSDGPVTRYERFVRNTPKTATQAGVISVEWYRLVE